MKISLDQRKKLLKKLDELNGKFNDSPFIYELYRNLAKKIGSLSSYVETLTKSSDLVPLSKKLTEIESELTKTKVGATGLGDNIEILGKDFQDSVTLLKAEIQNLKKDTSEIVEETKIDLIDRLNRKGGGSMNRQIRVEGVDVLTKYTDINIYGATSSVLSSVDSINKRVNIGIGGGVPGGLNTDVQFNDSGTFGGESDFTYDKTTNTLRVANNVYTRIVGSEDAVSPANLDILGGSALSGDNAGGSITINAGTGSGTQNGGGLLILAGDGGTTGNGGSYTAAAGNSGVTGGVGGNVTFQSGDTQSGDANGGAITFTAGAGHGTGVQGSTSFLTKNIYLNGTSDSDAFGKIYNDSTTFWVQGLATATDAGTHTRIQGGDGQAADTAGGMVYLQGGAYGVGGDILQYGFTATGHTITGFNGSNNIAGSLIVGNNVADFAVGNNLYVSTGGIFATGIGTGGKLCPTSGYCMLGTGQTAQTIGLDRKDAGGTDVGVDLTVQAGWATNSSTNKAGGNLNLAAGTTTGVGAATVNIQPTGGGGSGTSDRSPATTTTFAYNKTTSTVQSNTTSVTITSSSAHIAWNLDTAQNATHTATENTTLDNPTNMVDGGTYTIKFIQHASSPKTLAFGNAYKWPGGSVPAVTATNSAVDIFTFRSDGSNMYGVWQGNFS